ncbi:MAG TPA: T9SS type A sorting domain-containing protein [candidate division Zixibacteria bacterium]|nr:T9SS type A sorting domain-containing protein [candidate division Zixibacteria bacterium]
MKRMLLLAVLCWTHAVQAQNITGVEYYIDNDPGFGSATPVDISAGSDIMVSFTANLTPIDDGIHILYVRAQDANGIWSLSLSYPFLKSSIGTDLDPNITQVEYFIDNDPGFGSATPMDISSGSDVAVNFTAALNGLQTGLHILYVRARDDNGVWGLLHAEPFLKTPAATDPAPDITRIEYYIDSDPGFGSGTAVSPATGPDQTVAFTTNLDGIETGFHVLYTRARDANGHWSLPLAHAFLKEVVEADDPASIVQAEYFIDADPGFGHATVISLTPGTDIDLTFTAGLNGVTNGIHLLYVRTRDAHGTWSLPHARPFLMENGVADDPLPTITRIDYFFNKDGDVSTTRTFDNFNPVSDADLNFAANLSGLTSGDWVMQAAAIDAAGRSSLLFTRGVEVFAAAVGDITLDGVINITDVVALIQIILDQTPIPDAGSEAFNIADFNGDSSINILDLIGQINTILGVQTKTLAGANQPVKIGLGAAEMAEDNHGLLPITLSSTDRVAGFQADLTFDPAWLQIGNPYLTDEYAHIQIERHINGGTMRLLLYNAEGGVLSLAPDTKLLVPVTLLNESVEEAILTLNDITLAGPHAQALPITPGVTAVTIRALPKEFSLSTNRPNPFNPSTQIAYDVPEPAQVTLIIYNVLGQEIIRLVDERKQPGRYTATWTGKNRTGYTVASGVYLYRMATSTGYTAQRRMTLLK